MNKSNQLYLLDGQVHQWHPIKIIHQEQNEKLLIAGCPMKSIWKSESKLPSRPWNSCRTFSRHPQIEQIPQLVIHLASRKPQRSARFWSVSDILHIICTNVQVFYLAGSSERHLLKYFILLCLDPTSFIFQISDFEPSKHHKQLSDQVSLLYWFGVHKGEMGNKGQIVSAVHFGRCPSWMRRMDMVESRVWTCRIIIICGGARGQLFLSGVFTIDNSRNSLARWISVCGLLLATFSFGSVLT